MIEQGYVHDVSSRVAGSQTVAAAAVGATVLSVEDAADFPDTGSVSVTSLDVDGVSDLTTTYAYTSVDYDLDVLTLAAPLVVAADVGDRVDLWPVAVEKQAEVMLLDTEDAVTARVPHALSSLMAEGIRDADSQEFVTVELADDQWSITNVRAKEPSMASSTTDDTGDSVWFMDEETVQFQNAQADALGVDAFAANSVTLGGLDLQGDILDPMPLGTIVRVTPTTGVNSAQIGTTETVVFRINAGSLYQRRLYRIGYIGYLTAGTGTLVVGDAYTLRLRYTTDGSTPTTASPILTRSPSRIAVDNASASPAFSWFVYTSPDADYNNVRYAFTVQRQGGTGTAAVDVSSDRFELAIEDMGLVGNVGGTIAQISKATGSADTEPTATYTRTYWATDTQSYDGDGGKFSGDPNTPDMHQGYYGPGHGREFSLAYYDSAKIRADLAGATINSCKLTFRVKHAYFNAGVHVRVGLHNQSTPQSTQGEPSTVYGSRDFCKEGGTYTVELGVSDHGVGFGNALRDGTVRGTVFFSPGNNALTHYGQMYGGTTTSRPRLVISYSK